MARKERKKRQSPAKTVARELWPMRGGRAAHALFGARQPPRTTASSELRELEERVDATLRELGVTFELPSGGHHNTWFCDLLPQVFTSDEWSQVERGFEQRVRAFEMFLEDVYGPREILRQGIIPIPVVLGSRSCQKNVRMS